MNHSGKPTVAVYSQVSAGHVPAYHRLYVEAFSRHGCPVIDLPPPPVATAAGRFIHRLKGWVFSNELDTWRTAARRVRQAERTSGRRADFVLLVYGDLGFADPRVSPEAISEEFPWPWACVLNGPAAVRGAVAPFAGGEWVLAAKNCRAVVVTDSSFVDPCRQAWPGRTVLTMPEVAVLDAPVPSADLQNFRAFAAGRRVVGLLGVISAKKNVGAFVEMARRAERSHPDLVFVLAGDFTKNACPADERRALAPVLATLPPNCRLYPAPIGDGPEFNAWVAACDVVWLAYREVPYKSNLLTKAAHFRKPVLVSPGYVMARHVAEHRLGEVVRADDAEAVQAGLARVLAGSDVRRDYSAFTEANAPERLDETVRGLVAAFPA